MKKKEDSFATSNLISLLKSFTKEEFKQFEKFVHSPFHNNRNEVSRFFELLKKYYPGFDSMEFQKEKIYSKLYPAGKYKDDVIRRLSSNLFKLAEEYGAYKTFRNVQFDYNKYLLEFHLSRSEESLYLKQQNKTETYLEEQSLRDAKYFLNVNFLEELKRFNQIKSDPLGKKINIQKQIDSVWKYAIITLLRLYKVATENTKQFNKKYSTQHLEPLLKIIEASDFTDSKAVEIWYFVIRFHTNSRNDETFYRLKELLGKNFHIFDPIENFILHVSLLSYCYDMNIIPKNNFYKEEFEVLHQMLEGGLLFEEETINSEWFMYTFITALRAGEIRFAEKFLNDCKLKLRKRERDNIINHANAELAIEKKDYNAALKYLSVPKYNNVAEKLRANHMYIKIYYELGLTEQFFYTTDSFKHFIKDEVSLSKPIKVIRENFIKYITKLYRLKLKEINIPLRELKEEIMNSKILGNKWLFEKIEELEEKKN